MDELFKDNATGGISIDNKARIFWVVKTPVELNAQPEEIRPILGYEFYRKDPSNDRVKEFNKVFGQEIEQAYWAKLDDVAHDLAQLIEKMDNSIDVSANGNSAETQSASSVAHAATKRKIYLSDITYDLHEYHEILKRALEDSGFTVFPNKILPP